MFGLSYGEMLLFGLIALMLFGAKLPEVAKSLGGTYRELKKNINEFQKEFQAIDRYEPPPTRKAFKEDESPAESTTSAPKFTPPPEDDSENR